MPQSAVDDTGYGTHVGRPDCIINKAKRLLRERDSGQGFKVNMAMEFLNSWSNDRTKHFFNF